MDLILWRHADAEDGTADLARKLTPVGEQQAARTGAWLRTRLRAPYRLLVSPAIRCQQTARALDARFETRPELSPGAPVDAILAAAGQAGTAVIVGHQPDLGRAIAYLLCGGPRDWSVAKGALWWITGRNTVKAVLSPDLL